jgi:spermidine synthase
MGEPKNYKWFLDFFSPLEGHIHGIKNVVYATQTKFQLMEIMDTWSYGRCLVLDGKIQSSAMDEYIYHEALVHPVLLAHPDPKKIFVVGGGEGATLREILRHRSVEKVLMVDIDQEVVESCKTYLPEMHQGAFDDPRVELKYLDARKYLEETKEVYDVIVIDISEPVEEGPAYLLYTKEFYQIVQKKLSRDGMISLQAGTTACTALLNFSSVMRTLKTSFPVVLGYEASIPCFGLPWGFALASKTVDPTRISGGEMDKRIGDRIRGALKFFDGTLHEGLYTLPKFIRDDLAREDRIIEDNAPLFTYH